MTRPDFVLGLHPSSRGFGWALFEGPNALFDCGSVEIHGEGKNATTRARVEKLLDKYRPRVLTLEAFDHPASQRKPRIRVLYRILIACAEHRGIAVDRCARSEIAAVLGVPCPTHRQAIAEAVARRIGALETRVPPPKKIWLGERHHMGLFCAAACVLTHYDREEPRSVVGQ
jgi:hypothetical protein